MSGSLKVVEVCDMSVQIPIAFPDAQITQTVQVELQQGEGNALAAELSVLDGSTGGATWQRRSSATVQLHHASSGIGSPAPVDLGAVRARCLQTLDGATFYERFQEGGIAFGPRFRLIQLLLDSGNSNVRHCFSKS